jgi:hypothetical protein
MKQRQSVAEELEKEVKIRDDEICRLQALNDPQTLIAKFFEKKGHS